MAYNDLPLALGFLLALWALDAAVRRPGPPAARAGRRIVRALALGVKLSALALAPGRVVLMAWRPPRDRGTVRWWRDLGLCAAVGSGRALGRPDGALYVATPP